MYGHRRALTDYACVALAIAIATGLRVALIPYLGDGVPFIIYFPSIVLCAWMAGLRSGLLATFLAALVCWYFIIPPRFSFQIVDPSTVPQLLVFCFGGTLISLLAESLHRARARAEASEAKHFEEGERFRVTLSSIGDAVIATDAAGRVTFINPVAELLTGWTMQNAIGRSIETVFCVVNEQTRQSAANPALRAMTEGAIVGLENHTVLIAATGVETPVDDSGAPIKNTAGVIVGAILIFRDISERRRVEKERALLAGIVESSEDAIIAKTPDGAIESWNAAAERLFGYSAEEAIGRPLTMIVPSANIAEEELMQERLEAGQRVEHYETVRLARDGRFIPVALTVSPIRDRSGRLIGASNITRDISAQKRVEEQRAELLQLEQAARSDAEAANRAKDEFLATISHELRTPLTSILGWARLLRLDKLDTASTAHAISTIERNAKVQAQIIDDLLDVSGIVSGKLRLALKPVDMAEILSSVMETIQPVAENKSIQLATIVAGSVFVNGDATRLQQIVWNLLANAVKFTPKGGSVAVRLERRDGEALLEVRDTGKGISPQFLPHVFERFKQADNTSTRQHGGLGLGLAIVRQLVEMHGGAILADSDGDGQGATFTLRLPEVEAPAPARAASQAGVPRVDGLPGLDGLRVLVVDDDESSREIIFAILQECRAAVTTADSAARALEVLASARFDVLVSDIAMPGENGYELIARVRQLPHEQGGNMPAIALTAYARPEDRMRALAAGYQTHVPKPVEPIELALIVGGLTERRTPLP